MVKSIFLSSFVAIAMWAGVPLLAHTLKESGGPVILTVTGDFRCSDEMADGTVRFDLDGLRALDETRIETSTIWTDGTQVFRGTSLAAFVEALGIEEGVLRATAVNDYAVDIPVSDAVDGGPILAWHRNGAEMSLREKGPIWLIYPFDDDPDYRSEVIYSRSIWQLDRIEVIR